MNRKLNKIAQYLTLGCRVESEATLYAGTIEEIRTYQGEKFFLVKWPDRSCEPSGWYSSQQVDEKLLIA
jgi:hypothetical protein